MATSASKKTKAKEAVNDTRKKPYFRWRPEMIENLICCLHQYKTAMAYKNLDFDADKPIQYKELRLKMAALFEDEDASLFGAVNPLLPPEDFDCQPPDEQNEIKAAIKESKELIARGTKRIMEKVKEIRQNFSKAVVSGTRSGSGKIVYEFYDRLCAIWGGSPNIEKLSFGLSGEDFESNDKQDKDYELNQFESDDDELIRQDGGENESTSQESEEPAPKRVRVDQVPRLVDEKRKHLERRLSAAQRDGLLMKEAKDDSQFKKDLCEAMRESTAAFSESIKEISSSMTNIGNGICRSIEVLSQALVQQNQTHQPVNQNLFYQNEQRFHPAGGAHSQLLNESTHSQSSLGSYGSQMSHHQHYTNLR